MTASSGQSDPTWQVDERDGGDLAQKAAEWVPPWARQPQHAPGLVADENPEVAVDGEVEVAAEADRDAEAEVDAADGDAELSTDLGQLPHPRVAERLVPAEAPVAAEPIELPEGEQDGQELEAATEPQSALAVELPGLDEAELVPALEAIMLVVDEPVSEITLAQVLDLPAERIANALIGLSAAYTREGRGFDLRRAAGGWRLYTRSDYSPYVERFVLDGQQLRLTQASLETLAVVAYKQPVSRSRISAIRGVNCDSVIRTLINRGMVEECGTEPDSGAHLYRTTTLFLEKLGLDSVEQLPSLAPFLPDNIEEIADEQR